MAEAPVITRAKVAELLGISPATLVDRVGELRRSHGFPQALPGSGGRRYARALVLVAVVDYDAKRIPSLRARAGASLDQRPPDAGTEPGSGTGRGRMRSHPPGPRPGHGGRLKGNRMPRFHVRYLVEKPGAHGPRWFWQPSAELRGQGWKQQRLAANTQAEAIELAEALNAQVDAKRAAQQGQHPTKAPAGTVAAMVEAYRASKWWPKGERTGKDYGYYLREIEAWAGDMPARAVTPTAVQAFHTALEKRTEGKGRARRTIHTPARAAAAVRVLSALFSAGVRLGFVATNPALRAGITTERQRDPVLWTRQQLDHLMATADAMGWRSQATAMLLNFWCGQRQADILNLAPWRLNQGAIVLTQRKSGSRRQKVSLPVHLVPELVHRLEAERARTTTVASLTHMLLHETTGRPWQGFTFTHTFAEIRQKAAEGDPKLNLPAMPSCNTLRWMELRHTAVTALKAAGLDALAIASITGHTAQSVQAILDRHYLIRTSAAAEGAFRARLAKEGGV